MIINIIFAKIIFFCMSIPTTYPYAPFNTLNMNIRELVRPDAFVHLLYPYDNQ